MFAREWPGAGESVVVCLHAVGGSHAHWLGVAPELAARGRVIAPDLIGHGRSPRSSRGAGLDAQQEAVHRLLADTGPAALVGSSFGGGVAILQAVREPASVTGLVLTGSLLPPFDDGDPPKPSFTPYVRHRLRQRLRSLTRRRPLSVARATIVEAAIRNVVADAGSLDPVLVREIVASQGSGSLRELAAVTADAGRSTLRLLSHPASFAALLDRISCPVLIVHGRQDSTIPCAFAVASARLHPAWQFHLFERLGHLPHLEDAAAWLAIVEPWLDALPRRASTTCTT